MAQPRTYPKIVQDISGCVQDLKRDYGESKYPITDDSLALHKFCAKLEYLLQIDMKARTSVLGGRRDYWDYFYKCLSKVKGLNDGLRFVRAMTEVKSSLGRGRAFIRYSLVHHRLGDSLQQCIANTKITSEWYGPTAVLLNSVHSTTIVNACYDLNDIQFDLAPTGYDLDTAWPTFVRQSAAGATGLYLWRPPSRATSTSSINSQQSASDSYPNSPMVESKPSLAEDQFQRLQREFEDCEQLNRQLRQRVDQLELDNEEIHQMAQETEERMTALRLRAETESADFRQQVERLEGGLHSKEEELLSAEARWKARAQDAEKTASDLYNRIEVLSKQHESRCRMLEESERDLRQKLKESESSAGEARGLLSAHQADLALRAAAESSTKELVAQLESRLADAEARNLELISKMDDIVQGKDKTASSHFESANKVHELLTRLEGAESEKIQLHAMREELIRKLELVETQKSVPEKASSADEVDSPSKTQSLVAGENLPQIQELRKQNQELERGVTERNKAIEKLEAALQRSTTEKGTLEKQLNEVKRMVANLEESDWLLREEHKMLQRNLTLAEKERDMARLKASDLPDMESRLRETEQQAEELKNQNTKLVDLQSAFRGMMQDLEASWGDTKQVETALGIQDEALQKSASSNHVPIESLEGDSFQSQISSVLAATSSRTRQLTEALQDAANLKSENARLLSQLDESRKTQELDSTEAGSLRETIGHLQGKLADAGLRTESQGNVLKGKDSELRSMAEQMNMLQQRVSDLKESVVQKSMELETQHQSSAQASGQLKSQQKSLEKLAGEKEALEFTLRTVRGEYESLEREKMQLQNEKGVLERGLQEVREDFEKEKHTSLSLENTLEDTRRLMEENVSMEQVFEDRKEKMIKEHEDKVEFLTQQFNMIQEEIAKANEDKSRLEEEHSSMFTEHQAMGERLELMEAERNEIKMANDTLNTEIASVNETCQQALTEKKESQQKMDKLQSEMFEALEANTSRMLRLENELYGAQKDRDGAKLQITQLEADMKDTRDNLQQAEERHEEKCQQLKSLECVMQQEVSALKFQLSSEAMVYQQTIQGYKHQEAAMQGLQDKLAAQEDMVDGLQSELNLARALLEQQQNKAKEAQEKAVGKEAENTVLQEAILQMSKALEDLQVCNLNSEEELSHLRSSSRERTSSMETGMLELERDNVELKKQIIKLIKDKDTLWQWTDKLDYQRKLKASERWIEDSKVTHCMQCHVEFSLMVRRHHCRLCGRIFCTKCSSCYVSTAHSRKKSRVCEECYVVHQHASEPTQATPAPLLNIDSDEELEGAAMSPVRSRTSVSSDSHRSTPTAEPSASVSSLEGAVEPTQGMDLSLSPAEEPEEEPVGDPMMGTSDNPTGTSQMDSCDASCPVNVLPPGSNPIIVLDSPLPSRHSSVQSRSGSEDREDFDLISEEEITAARSDWSASLVDSPARTRQMTEQSAVTGPTVHASDLEELNGANDEIIIKAGQSHAVPVHLDSPGIILCWEFASAPKTVAFAVTYQPANSPPSDGISNDQPAPTDELIPLCKCNSHRHAIQGELMARKAGIYTLLFDNSFSRFTQKSVKYSLQVKRPEAAY